MKKLLLGSCVVAVCLFGFISIQEQEEVIIKQEAQIKALVKQKDSLDLLVEENTKALEEVTGELTELKETNVKLLEDNQLLQEENDKLQNKLDSMITIEATAYTPFCNTGCTGVTATGLDVANTKYHDGKIIIAVDPNVIPLGSTVKVHTSGGTFLATAQDTGGDIKGNRIDVLFLNKKKAKDFGRQSVTVELL